MNSKRQVGSKGELLKKLTLLFVSPESEDRHNNINLIRFVSAAMVVYGHMAHLVGAPVPNLFGEEVSTIAVKVFFVLSGYLITQSFMRDDDFFRYMVRRIFRIFPGLIFVCFMLTFIIGPCLSTLSAGQYFSHPQTYAYFLHNSALFPDYFLPGVFTANPYPDAVNGSLWTLPVEFSMYLLLPLLVVVFRKLNLLKAGMIGAAVLFACLDIAYITQFSDARFIIWGSNVFQGLVLAPYFFAGSLFVFPEIKERLNIQVAFVLAFLLGIVIWGDYWKYEILVLLMLPYITLACSFATPALFGRVFAVNDYSYGLYVWGFPVQQTLISFLGADAFSLVSYTIISFLVATACAMVSWFVVEKPGNRLGKRITQWSRHRSQAKEAEAGKG